MTGPTPKSVGPRCSTPPASRPTPRWIFLACGALWRGDIADPYAEAAVIGTLAIALKALGAADNIPNSEARAKTHG